MTQDLPARALYEHLRADKAPSWDDLSETERQRWREHLKRLGELSRYEQALIRARGEVGDAKLREWLNP